MIGETPWWFLQNLQNTVLLPNCYVGLLSPKGSSRRRVCIGNLPSELPHGREPRLARLFRIASREAREFVGHGFPTIDHLSQRFGMLVSQVVNFRAI